jgi:NAD(P)-dependent dehydrogenase (short-subunit alcohol dehydrogenase family)
MHKNLLDFTNKTVLITGASTGIGRATALAFAKQGANVALGDMKEELARETVELIEKEGAKAFFVKTNVSQARDVEELIQKTAKTFKRIDCAFNNAGILHPLTMIDELEEETFDSVLSVDLKGVFLCMKYEIQHMLKFGGGAIVNTASIAGLNPEAGAGAYVAAKHGVIGLSKTAALENADRGIRVNVLAPGWVKTPMTQAFEDDPELHQKLLKAAPMHRGAEPQEMSGMVLFLCSEAASYVTGQTYVVDGAQMIRGLLPFESGKHAYQTWEKKDLGQAAGLQ